MIWNLIKKFNDGKFNWDPPNENANLPGYVDHPEHPFTFCNSLTHLKKNSKEKDDRFCHTDGPDQFTQNIKKMPNDWKYRAKEVKYKINISGYRTKEWNQIDWGNSVVMFGCSCTFGVGIAEDETISYHLEKILNRPVINLGYPSGSNNLILNNSSICFEKFGVPWGVVINWTTTDRFRYYTKNNYIDLGPWQKTNKTQYEDGVDVANLWFSFYQNVYNENASNYYISKAANAIWKNRTRYCTLSFFDQAAHVMRVDKSFTINPNDRARDLLHPGESDSIRVANFIAERFK